MADVITVEVIDRYLASVAREMKTTIMRTASSPIIYEVLDFSTGLFDRRARLVAQASGLAIFLGTLDWAVQAVIDKFGVDGLAPGDIVITNDPYRGGGTHLNDVAMVRPVFADGELLGFCAVRAHWLDVGGKSPFSQMTDAYEIYQEGLLFPVIKLYEAGEANEPLLATILANVRNPGAVRGDLNSQIAACELGDRRLRECVARYGVDTVYEAIDTVLDAAEVETRHRIEQIPDGRYVGADSLDSDGTGDEPRTVRVVVTKTGSDIEFDFSDTDEATRSSYNMGYCALVSASRVMLKCITTPDGPANAGSFRSLTVQAKPGTMVCAQPPTPICMYGDVGRRVVDAVWKALAGAIGDRLPAAHYGSVCAQGLAGWDDRTDPPRFAMHGGPNAGGWGGGPGSDGESALICISNGDTRNTPVEIIEAHNPLIVHRYELVPDSGGPGEFRGGLGTVISYELTSGLDYTAVFIIDRVRFAPFGLAGGCDGRPNGVLVERAGREIGGLAKTTGFRLERGDLIHVEAGGGGGWGDPARRDEQKVLSDLKNGYVTLAGLGRYGRGGEEDEACTPG